MATEKKDDAVIEVEDEGTVVVDLPDGVDDPANKDADDKTGAQDLPPLKDAKDAVAKEPRQRKSKATEDEAAAALTQAIRNQETAEEERNAERKRREAAEATAAAERRGREDAQRLAERHSQEAKGYREQAEQGEMAAVTAAIDNATKRIVAAKASHRSATEAADFDKVSDAMEEMADAKTDLKIATQRKADLESGARRQPAHEGRVEAPPAPAQTSQFEQYVSAFTPRSQAWLRSHPDYAPGEIGGDPVKNSKMMAGHYAAKSQGIPPDTDDYFRIIEEHAGIRQPAAAAATSAAADVTPAQQQRRPAPSAPPSREPPAPSGQRPRTTAVTLSRDEQEMAKISWPHKPEREAFALYAQNKLALEAEGKLGRSTH